MIQLLTNIMVFLWEVFMEKNKPGETIASKTDRLKRFFVFIAASLSIVLNVVLMERLIRVSTNHVALNRAYDAEVLRADANDKAAAVLLSTQHNLQMCLLNRR